MQLTQKIRRFVEMLTWRTIDQDIDEPDFRQLEGHLRESDEARRIYVDACWLHAALLFHFTPSYGRRFVPALKTTEDRFMAELMASEPLADQRKRARAKRAKKPAALRKGD